MRKAFILLLETGKRTWPRWWQRDEHLLYSMDKEYYIMALTGTVVPMVENSIQLLSLVPKWNTVNMQAWHFICERVRPFYYLGYFLCKMLILLGYFWRGTKAKNSPVYVRLYKFEIASRLLYITRHLETFMLINVYCHCSRIARVVGLNPTRVICLWYFFTGLGKVLRTHSGVWEIKTKNICIRTVLNLIAWNTPVDMQSIRLIW